MSFPWLAWLKATTGGSLAPLLAAIACQAIYYFVGLYLLLRSHHTPPEFKAPEEPDLPGGSS